MRRKSTRAAETKHKNRKQPGAKAPGFFRSKPEDPSHQSTSGEHEGSIPSMKQSAAGRAHNGSAGSGTAVGADRCEGNRPARVRPSTRPEKSPALWCRALFVPGSWCAPAARCGRGQRSRPTAQYASGRRARTLAGIQRAKRAPGTRNQEPGTRNPLHASRACARQARGLSPSLARK
jgi:hypothetical protein